jgi:hypothetical protein
MASEQPIECILRVAPDWAEVTFVHVNEVNVDALAVRASGNLSRLYTLAVAFDGREVLARERAGAKLLPDFCPERHVNEGGTFCLGLNAGWGISDTTAGAWWVKLKSFLLCQDTASETGIWPDYAQMSHGDAGEIEAKAEQIAQSIGRLGDFHRAVRSDDGPIAACLDKVRTTGQLRNGRSACLCGRKDGKGRSILRRECHKLGCPIELEFARRRETRRFWDAARGRPCCRTMKDCPLDDRAALVPDKRPSLNTVDL